MSVALALALVVGCRGVNEPATVAAGGGAAPSDCDVPDSADGLLVTSPSPGVILRGPWIPVRIRLDELLSEAEVTWCVDGERVADPLGVIGDERNEWIGGGWDYIGYLDLRPLEPGQHVLTARVEAPTGEVLGQRSVFTYDRPPHEVRIGVVDGAGAPTAARVTVLQGGVRAELASPDAAAVDPKGRDAHIATVTAPDGEAWLFLDPGPTTFVVSRSPLDDVAVLDLELSQDVDAEVTLRRVIEVPERLLADLHVHTVGSRDSFVPDRVRFESLVCAGLDLAAITDHDRVSSTAAAVREAIPLGPTRVWEGVEANLEVGGSSIGHLNAFPIEGAAVTPLPSVEIETVGGALDAWRARQAAAPAHGVSDIVLQLNHPRGIQFTPDTELSRVHDLFNELGGDVDDWIADVDPATGTRAVDFDLLEVVNRFSFEAYLEVRQDWFDLMERAVPVGGVGNSDSHALEVELAGYPVNLVGCPAPEIGEELDHACVVSALRAADVTVTTGPVVDLTVTTASGTAGPGGALTGRSAEVVVRVRAAAWVVVDEVRLVVGGAVVEARDVDPTLRDVDGVLDASWTFSVELVGSSWILAEAGWPLDLPTPPAHELGLYGVVAPGYVPLGFTNPVWVDAG